MSFIKAGRETVFDPKHGGIRVVCERVGISEGVLRNKVDERNESNHLRLDEAFRIMLELKDYRIMQAMAYELGGTFDLLPDVDVDENEHIVTLLLGATSKHGQVCDVIHQALADVRHRIDGLEKLQKQLISLQEVRHRIDGLEKEAQFQLGYKGVRHRIDGLEICGKPYQ